MTNAGNLQVVKPGGLLMDGTERRPSTDPPVNHQAVNDRDAELRADIRRVGALLGRTLVRQHGEDLLDLVEQVRKLTKQSREAAEKQERDRATGEVRAILAGLPISAATDLVRAFATYFHLANGAEQVHRVRALRSRPATDGHLAAVVTEIAERLGREELEAAIGTLAVQPAIAATGAITGCRVWFAVKQGPSATVNCNRSAVAAMSSLAPIGIRIVGALNRLNPAPVTGSTCTQALVNRIGSRAGPVSSRTDAACTAPRNR